MFSARAFPIRSALFSAFAAASLVFVPALRARSTDTPSSTSAKREAVRAQYDKAEDLRSYLNDTPVLERTLAGYKQVVNAYRHVTLITPRAPEVPDSLFAIAELSTEMGDHFGRGYFQSAVDTYQFLVHEYPAHKFCAEALLRIARLQKDRLGDSALAAKTYEEFVKRYPRSPRRREAQEALAELALLRQSDPPASSAASPARESAAKNSDVSHERAKSQPAKNSAEPAAIPHIRRISSTASTDAARITIDLDDKVTYSSARIANPDRIYFDISAAQLTPELARREIQPDGRLVKAVRVAQNQAGVVRIVFDVVGVLDYSASLVGSPPSLVIDFYASAPALRAATRSAGTPKPAVTTAVRETLPVASSSKSPSLSAGNSSPDAESARPPKSPQPTREGQSTLTRTLGLKIGRIVIDAGHGGHDTGTIGPTGLMEKDICLDVALRPGQIIEQHLPGAEVVYTRADDTFIPLEERTNIANEKKADLFLSIHANSSRDHAARGVETYYLNLKGTPEAMEVAARENSTAQETVADLEELVKKITRNEKIEESREFAEDIQDSLSRRIQHTTKSVKSRGIRKAPFVVLIGANMPSVLAEISFLSNPADEQLMKKGDHRQRLAEGLYQGVVSYLQSLNSVTYNLPSRNAASGRLFSGSASGAPAGVEQSRNQQ